MSKDIILLCLVFSLSFSLSFVWKLEHFHILAEFCLCWVFFWFLLVHHSRWTVMIQMQTERKKNTWNNVWASNRNETIVKDNAFQKRCLSFGTFVNALAFNEFVSRLFLRFCSEIKGVLHWNYCYVHFFFFSSLQRIIIINFTVIS